MTDRKKITAAQGLTSTQAKELQAQFGKNELTPEKKESFIHKILEVVSEPMFLLLIIAAVVYFILGKPRDGAIMLVFVLAIISIDLIQEWKTDKTLKALKDLSAPHIKVIRDGEEKIINSADLVPGDLMLVASVKQLLLVCGISFIAVMWYELVKLVKYLRNRTKHN